MDQEPSPTGVRQGQCLSNFRCSQWIMKLVLCIVIIILSFIWSRIELASQKRSEHRAIVMLFCDIYVLLCMCVCVCVYVHAHEIMIWSSSIKDHSQQPPEVLHRHSNLLLSLWSWESLKIYFESYYYILEINTLLITSFENIFFFSIGCLFVFFNGFLCAANSFKFNQVTFIYFCFCFHYFRGQIQKIVLWFMSRVFCLCFPLRSCLTKNLVLQSLLIYLFLLYFYMILENALIISFTCSHADFPKVFIEETAFSLLHNVTSFVFD